MYIGIDLGGTKIAAGLVTDYGEILFQTSVPTKPERGSEEVIKDIILLITKASTDLPEDEDLKGIGIGIPGYVIDKDGHVFCVNLGWDKVDLKGPIEREFSLPVFIENDAKVAALAEYMVGSLKGTKNSMLITLGTGVGGGVILNGELFRGTNGKATEIGHMVIGENFYNCNCGRNGCFETFASATAIIRYAKKRMNEHRETMLLAQLEGNIDLLEAKHILECAQQGDNLSIQVIDRFIHYLVIGMSNLANIFDPEVISIGGGVSKAGNYLLELIHKHLNTRDYNFSIKDRRIITATLGNEAGIVGAAMLIKVRRIEGSRESTNYTEAIS